MILHIPHSSIEIPDRYRNQFVLSDDEMATELRIMTDAFTDELFELPGATSVRFPYSRLVVDVERFPVDSEELMSKVGMGMIYSRTAHGKHLRRSLSEVEREELRRCYDEHHQRLTHAVQDELNTSGKALVVDCHSFPTTPLPCDMNQTVPRPDFCIGTERFHTPAAIVETAVRKLRGDGFHVQVNEPYAGALVPLSFFEKDNRVASIMIEVSRHLYMDETTGERTNSFESVKRHLQLLLRELS